MHQFRETFKKIFGIAEKDVYILGLNDRQEKQYGTILIHEHNYLIFHDLMTLYTFVCSVDDNILYDNNFSSYCI